MTALKLFVSHSSRLDDIEHKYTDDDHNWRLLKETCEAIKARYGDRVEVLVDQNGLVAGDKWNDKLNLWLAECHAAIILFSKRAIDKSEWVKKEATVLSWRAELDDGFTLIPVLLEGETTPADLAKDFFGVLNINHNQGISNALTADDIVTGVLPKLDELLDLKDAYPSTPLERLQGGIAKLLSEQSTEASILAALDKVGCKVLPDGTANRQRYADLLARHLINESSEKPLECFKLFQLGLDPLTPQPVKERAFELFHYIRSLWVEPSAASCLPVALRHKCPLAMVGQLTTLGDPFLSANSYTLERYLERAWPGSRLYTCVTLTGIRNVGEVRTEIRRRFLSPGLPPFIDESAQDKTINEDPKTIILVVPAMADDGGLPDHRFIHELEQLKSDYERLIVIFAIGPDIDTMTSPALPDGFKKIEPALDSGREQGAYLAERAARTYLNNRYGISS